MNNVNFTKNDFEIIGKNIDESEKIVRKVLHIGRMRGEDLRRINWQFWD